MKEQIEVDLKEIFRDLDGLSPKTSTYIKLKDREKVLRNRLRGIDSSYARPCTTEGCYEMALQKKFFDGVRRYHKHCAKHKAENVEAKLHLPFSERP